jgi:hypothetical protein
MLIFLDSLEIVISVPKDIVLAGIGSYSNSKVSVFKNKSKLYGLKSITIDDVKSSKSSNSSLVLKDLKKLFQF